jgi:peptidylprolyl isomerase
MPARRIAALGLFALVACRDRSPSFAPEPGSGSSAPQPSAPADATTEVPPEAPARVFKAIPPPPDLAAPPTTAARTPLGVASVVVRPGRGKKHPEPGDLVKVEYTAWTSTGDVFDSSVQRGAPDTIPFAATPRAWREAVGEMTVGEKRRLWIPADAAAQGRTKAAPGPLVYEVALLEITSPPSTPEDLLRAPADAKRTPSGSAYRRLTPGTGKAHPSESNMLTVNYTAWSEDGSIVESTILQGRPAERPLSAMPAGTAEVLREMVAGERVRIWVPAGLVGVDGGTASAALVYDVELLSLR